jgi:hypothetical protein
MADKTVKEYIEEERKRGVPLSAIKKALVDAGHNLESIERHIKSEEGRLIQDGSLDNGLLKYISYWLNNGKSLDDISRELETAGHSPATIKMHAEHLVKSKPKAVFGRAYALFSVVFLLSVFLLWAIFIHSSPVPQELCTQSCADEECRTACYDSYYLEKALAEGNMSHCSQLSSAQGECRDRVINGQALRELSAAKCSEISTPQIRESCKSLVSSGLAYSSGNISICSGIADDDGRVQCIDSFYHNEAIRNMSLLMCGNITDESRQQSCLAAIYQRLAVLEDKPGYCGNISDEGQALFCMDEYYRGKAIGSGDASVCSRVADPDRKSICADLVIQNNAIRERDSSACRQISNDDIRKSCEVKTK